MVSNLVTPPDIVKNNLHSVLLVDPEQMDLDAVIRFCQYSDQAFNLYVYTPNMNDTEWLQQAADVCDTVIVNSRSGDFNDLCLLNKTYYYGDRLYVENQQKIIDPLHYFAAQAHLNK